MGVVHGHILNARRAPKRTLIATLLGAEPRSALIQLKAS
jgi:hypothetical protein